MDLKMESNNAATEVDRDEVRRMVARLDELTANLKSIQTQMEERSIESLSLPEKSSLAPCFDPLIQFVAQAEQSLASHATARP